MNNRKSTLLCLAKAINEGLIKKFGKIPSANIFANQFNLRAYGTKQLPEKLHANGYLDWLCQKLIN